VEDTTIFGRKSSDLSVLDLDYRMLAPASVRTGEFSANIGSRMAEHEDQEEPHDVLAAEEFVVPAPDRLLHHEPVDVPEDPDDPEGQSPPHDVLAGEEFPIPAAPGGSGPGEGDGSPGGPGARSKAAAGVALLAGLVAVLRRRRGGKTG